MNVSGHCLAMALLAGSILVSACRFDQTDLREEKYVTVRLNDSLSRYDSVQILILAGTDTNAIVGKAWDGRLAAPQGIPPFRLDDAETRSLSVRVKGFDPFGRLTLDLRITMQNGAQVVTDMILPKPSPALAALEVGPGALSPAFDPAVKEYAVALANNQTWLQVTMTPAYPQAIMSAGVARAYSGKAIAPIDMRIGDNRITLNVTAADTSTQYFINAKRASASTDTVKNPVDTVPDFPFAAWRHMALVSPDFQQVGMGASTVVADFPVLLRLTKSNFNFSEADEGGKDIRFATLDDRPLPHEIASWDTRSGTARIWLRTDTLRGDMTASPILMYWGNPAASDASDPSKVFSPELGWSGVWHLEEDGQSRSKEYKDATGRFNGFASGKTSPSRKEGTVGYAQDFKTSNDQSSITLPETFDPGPEAWTIQMWVKQENQAKSVLFAKGDDTHPDANHFQIFTQADAGRLGLQRNGTNYLTNIYLPVGAWSLVGIVYDGAQAHVFIDGAEREAKPWTQGPQAFAKTFLGAANADGANGFHGTLDEIWVSHKAFSAIHMRLLWESQKPYSDFITLLPLR